VFEPYFVKVIDGRASAAITTVFVLVASPEDTNPFASASCQIVIVYVPAVAGLKYTTEPLVDVVCVVEVVAVVVIVPEPARVCLVEATPETFAVTTETAVPVGPVTE